MYWLFFGFCLNVSAWHHHVGEDDRQLNDVNSDTLFIPGIKLLLKIIPAQKTKHFVFYISA